MGIDYCAAISHSLSLPEIVSLPLALNSRPTLRETLLAIDTSPGRSLRKLLFKVGFAKRQWRWWDKQFERHSSAISERFWNEGWGLMLQGPITTAYIYRHVCELCYYIKWRYFLTDDTMAYALRVVCHELAAVFNPQLGAKQRAIYFPDSEGLSGSENDLDDVLTALRHRFGPPAKSIREIYDVDEHGSWTGDGFYVDDFRDLSV